MGKQKKIVIRILSLCLTFREITIDIVT